MSNVTTPDEPQLTSAGRAVPVALRKRPRIVFEAGKFLSETGADLTARQIDFGKAMEVYKRKNRRPHPTYSQVLDVIDSMGYRLVAATVAMPGFDA